MANSLNRSCVTFARGKITQGDVNKSSAWAISAAEKKAILGDPPDWSAYSKWHLGIDPNGDKQVQDTYSYPIGKGGRVYRAALTAIRQRAGQQGDQDIFSAAGRLLNQIDSTDKTAATIDIKFSVPYAPSPEDSSIREFGGVAYSGGIIPNYGIFGDCAIDLTALKETTVFALVNHDEDQRAGYGLVKRVGNELHLMDGKFMSTDAGGKISAELAEGAPWQLSIGMVAETHHFHGKKEAEVNGNTLEVDTLFLNPRITEVSFVPAGADPNTTVYGFSAQPNFETPEEDPMEIEQLRLEKDELAAKVNELAAQVTESRKDRLKSLGLDLSESEVSAFVSLDQAQFSDALAVLTRLVKQAAQPEHLFKGAQVGQQEKSMQAELNPVEIYKRLNAGVRQ